MRNHLFVLLLLGACVGEPTTDKPTGPDPNSPRVLDGLQVLYTFDEGDGLVVHDTSGVEPAFDLSLDNLVTNQWITGGGVDVVGPSVITSPNVAEKVFVACVQANAVTLEAWVEPLNITQTSTLFSYSKQNQRNVTLSQTTAKYQGSVMTGSIDPMTMMETGSVSSIQTYTNVAAPAAQHIVFTRDATGSSLYVDGVDTKNPMTQPPTMPPPETDLDVWSPAYQLVLGNESNGGRPFLGKIYLAAVYCKKFTPADVTKNFSAGY